ncbi:hypothetical protein AGMMS50268_20810 [Spirochaetia bacterium]|nr:hypothetical protein AGMMS50268_20810 [Spirochaetia bacterium]
MKSMTGFAYREVQENNFSLSVEIRSYNSRFLEIYVNLPPWLSTLETAVREYIASRCVRGKIEVSLRLREHNAPVKVAVNQEAVRAYGEAIQKVADILQIDEKPSLAMILGMEGVLEIERNRDAIRQEGTLHPSGPEHSPGSSYWDQIEPVLKNAVDDFDAERVREGRHTQEDILSHIAILESSLKTVSSFAPQIESSIKENLKSRFAEVLGNQIDENRILAETAVLLMKYTISEELSRLSSHLAEFRAETERNPSPGKKLDFLCQEINREINTIGSKTPILEVSRAVVDMKNSLENVREQLRNVE